MEKIKELLKGYGYEEEEFYQEGNKFRFVKDNSFVDIWFGKKGTTIGIYNPADKTMNFKRKVDILEIERIISNL
jgi:hypothetical protein